MSNTWFTSPTALVPNTDAKAEDVNDITAAVNAAFDKFPIASTTSDKGFDGATKVGTPTAGVHAANKSYVDAVIAATASLAVRKSLGNLTGTVTLDLSLGTYFYGTATGNFSFAVTNYTAGTLAQGFVVEIINGGAFTFTSPAGWRWPGGTTPLFTVSGTDIIVATTRDNGTAVHVSVAQRNV